MFFFLLFFFLFPRSGYAAHHSRCGPNSIDWYRHLLVPLHGFMWEFIQFGRYFGIFILVAFLTSAFFLVNCWCSNKRMWRVQKRSKFKMVSLLPKFILLVWNLRSNCRSKCLSWNSFRWKGVPSALSSCRVVDFVCHTHSMQMNESEMSFKMP